LEVKDFFFQMIMNGIEQRAKVMCLSSARSFPSATGSTRSLPECLKIDIVNRGVF